jgi:hypothetical protein
MGKKREGGIVKSRKTAEGKIWERRERELKRRESVTKL